MAPALALVRELRYCIPMTYGYKNINGTVHISRMSGNAHETDLAAKAGWTIYMTTDNNAYRDGMRLARRIS